MNVQKRCQRFLLVVALFGAMIYFPQQSDSTTVEQQAIQTGKPSLSNDAFGWDQLSPGVGCALSYDQLMWSNDGGIGWTDITPPRSSDESVMKSFFLDATHGWAVIVHNVAPDELQAVRVVRTEDGGRTWTEGDFEMSSFPGLKRTIAVPKALWFVDINHGWLEWRVQSSSAFDFGLLHRTTDGGNTWAELPGPPSGGDLKFYSSRVGWLVGGGSNQDLHVTRDAGETWEKISVAAPGDCDKCFPEFSLPEFHGGRNGILKVVFHDYSNLEGRHSTSTYVTRNGGRSWKSVSNQEQIGPIVTEGGPSREWHHCQLP
jgi:hypothetical protein